MDSRKNIAAFCSVLSTWKRKAVFCSVLSTWKRNAVFCGSVMYTENNCGHFSKPGKKTALVRFGLFLLTELEDFEVRTAMCGCM